MRPTRTAVQTFALACLCLFAIAATHAAAPPLEQGSAPNKYKIFCVKGKVEIEDKTLEEMRKESEDADACLMTDEEFENLYQARDAAKREFGGAGAPCECEE